MRKIVISLLLASVAVTPAMAQTTREERQAAREEARQSARESVRERVSSTREDRRSTREDRRSAVSTESSTSEPAARVATPRADLRDRANAARDRIEAARQDRQPPASASSAQVAERNRLAGRGTSAQAADQKARIESIRQRLKDSRVEVSRTPRYGTQPPPPVTTPSTPTPTWHRDSWRRDHRYDWSNWRYNNGWMFNLGYYNDPYGWGYYPYSYGSRMWPSYYQQSYWIQDPWMYRLPYPPPGTRWIRYYNDVMLVDTWSGQVLDVIYDFFW